METVERVWGKPEWTKKESEVIYIGDKKNRRKGQWFHAECKTLEKWTKT